MTDEQTYPSDVSPDSLMSDFRGRGILAILAFTVIVHLVIVVGSSYSYLREEVFGEDTSTLSESDRIDLAVREATTALREIAEKHGISPQDLSSRFASNGLQAAPKQALAPGVTASPASPEEPKSPIEQTLQKKDDGPDQPDLSAEDDLF